MHSNNAITRFKTIPANVRICTQSPAHGRLEPAAERISVTQQPRIEPQPAAEPRERKYDLDPDAEETIGDVASQNALDLERRDELSDTFQFQDLEEDGGGGGADFASFGGSRGPASVFGDGPSGGGGGQGRHWAAIRMLI